MLRVKHAEKIKKSKWTQILVSNLLSIVGK